MMPFIPLAVNWSGGCALCRHESVRSHGPFRIQNVAQEYVGTIAPASRLV